MTRRLMPLLVSVVLVSVGAFVTLFPEVWRGCPWGSVRQGVEPPQGNALWCERADGRLEGPYTGFWGPRRVATQGRYRNGLREGWWQTFHNSGTLSEEGLYAAGKREGRWVFFHQSGELRSEGSYHRNISTGPWRFFHANGALFSQGDFLNGQLHGEHAYWWANGAPLARGMFGGGKRNGPWKTWHQNLQLAFEGSVLEDQADGLFQAFSPDGTLLLSGTYDHGKQVGRWTGSAVRNPQKPPPPWAVEDIEPLLGTWMHVLQKPVAAPVQKPGWLFPAVVQRDVVAQSWTLRTCMARHPTPRVVTARWDIVNSRGTPEDEGLVSHVELDGESEPDVARCLKEALERWRFEGVFDGDVVKASYDIDVVPRDMDATIPAPVKPVPFQSLD
jgi:antitoxin component YwqK of YwqJK toxin-antitoxin module